MDALVAAITERVNPGGQKEISVRSLGTNMVQIIMPAVSGATAKEKQAEMDEIKRIISKTGALEFRIVATTATTIAHRSRGGRPQSGLGEIRPAPTTTMPRSIPIPRRAKRKAPSGAASARQERQGSRKASGNPATAPATIQLSYKDKEGNEITHTEVLVLAPGSRTAT